MPANHLIESESRTPRFDVTVLLPSALMSTSSTQTALQTRSTRNSKLLFRPLHFPLSYSTPSHDFTISHPSSIILQVSSFNSKLCSQRATNGTSSIKDESILGNVPRSEIMHSAGNHSWMRAFGRDTKRELLGGDALSIKHVPLEPYMVSHKREKLRQLPLFT